MTFTNNGCLRDEGARGRHGRPGRRIRPWLGTFHAIGVNCPATARRTGRFEERLHDFLHSRNCIRRLLKQLLAAEDIDDKRGRRGCGRADRPLWLTPEQVPPGRGRRIANGKGNTRHSRSGEGPQRLRPFFPPSASGCFARTTRCSRSISGVSSSSQRGAVSVAAAAAQRPQADSTAVRRREAASPESRADYQGVALGFRTFSHGAPE